jgi:hypothetical protein
MRYEDVTEDVVEVFLNVLERVFPLYQYLKFKLVFDTKRKVSKARLVFASVELASDKIKFFSKDNVAVDGYDYILVIDRKAWELANAKDRERLIRHEMRHVFVDEKGVCKLIGHEIEDFYAEIEANKDDPEWGRKLAILVNDVYEQEKEIKKSKNI